MRIIKKPKIKPVTCKHCGCVFKPKYSELKHDLFITGNVRDYAECPICNYNCKIDFLGKETESCV